MKILISGAGVAGLALAGFLKKHNVEVDIIDSAKAFRNIGYTVLMWPLGGRILNKLELSDNLSKKVTSVSRIGIVDHMGKLLDMQDIQWARKQYGDIYTVTREDLHGALTQLVGAGSISFGTTVETIKAQKDFVTVTFSSGKKKKYDLVISSEGVHSKIRKMIFDVLPTSYHYSVWISWLKKNPKLPKNPRFVLGTDAHIIAFPSKGGHSVGYFFVKRDSEQLDPKFTSLAHLKLAFKDFESVGKEIVESITDEPAHVYQDDMRKVNLDDWSRGRIVLMGDAEHAMTPVMGMGSSLALEDAFVLYDELLAISFDSEKVDGALKRYAERRQPRVSEIEKYSDVIMALAVNNKIISMVRDQTLKTNFASDLLRNTIQKILDRNI